MRAIFVFIYTLLREIRARMVASKRGKEVVQSIVRNNPTCRIESSSINRVELGKYVAILSGAILDEVNISDFSYISNGSVITNASIGKFCSVGPKVQIGFAPHPAKVFVSTYPAFYSAYNTGCPLGFRENKIFDDKIPRTPIGNDVWIGASVIIPGGICIGTGAIIAAGAVVVKDVPPYAIVGGNPARIIRYRFSEEQIRVLLGSEWWNWPIDEIRKHRDDFSDIERFMEVAN